MKKKVIRIVSMMLCGMMLLTGCGGSSGGSSSGGSSTGDSGSSSSGTAHDSTVRIALNGEPTSMHPGFSTSVVGNQVGMQMYEPLIMKVDNEYIPWLASSWELSEDNLDLTFELRDDVYFHNGEKMTAEDVAFTYNQVIASSYSEAMTGFMDNMEVIDDTHCVLHCKYVYGAIYECVSSTPLGIFSKSFYEEKGQDAFMRDACGTGPYEFVEWASGASVKMKAFDNYWGENKASIENVEFVIYNNAATSAALALENGEIDVLTTVSATDYERLLANDKLNVVTTPGASIAFIQFSMEDGSLFQDENMRLAIAHAINKEEVLIGAAEGYGVPANAIFPEYSFGIADSDYTAPSYDPDKAKEYLAAAGYPDGVDISIVACSTDSYYKPVEVIQSQLAQVGINLTVEKMEQNAWFEDVWRSGTYGMNVLVFSCTVPDVLYYYQMFVSSGTENFGSVNVPDLDEAYERALSTTDLDARAEAVVDVIRAFGDHAVCVPIYELDKQMAATNDLNGFEADPVGYFYVSNWSWGE